MYYRTVLLWFLIFAYIGLSSPNDEDQPKSRRRRNIGGRMLDKLLTFFDSGWVQGFKTVVQAVKAAQNFSRAFDTTQEPFYDYDVTTHVRSSFLVVVFASVLPMLFNVNFV